jgi:hypothetical protein
MKKFSVFTIDFCGETKRIIIPEDRIKMIEEFGETQCILYFNDTEERFVINGNIFENLTKISH